MLGHLKERITAWARRRSPWIIHFNSGACNACDIETVASLTPRYDLERFGVQLKGTPRHADVLVCTGPVTKQMKDRLVRIYEQMPEPKLVVAVGDCGRDGGIFGAGYATCGGVSKVLPVDVVVPGCPPPPIAILEGILAAVAKRAG